MTFTLFFFFEEFPYLPYLEGQIVFLRLGPELDFPGFDNGLLLLGFLLFFLQLVPELVEIHDPADGRVGLVGNLDQIKPLLHGGLEGGPGADDAALAAVGIDQPHLAVVDVLVDLDFQILL